MSTLRRALADYLSVRRALGSRLDRAEKLLGQFVTYLEEQQAYYRCRYPQEYALANRIDHPKNVIIREDALITPLDQWLAHELAPPRREQIIAALAQTTCDLPATPPQDNLIATYDAKIARYRAALDAGADPSIVVGWITETQAERDNALAHISRATPGRQRSGPLTADDIDIAAVLDELGDIVTALAEAEPDHKCDLYRELRLRLTYRPDTRTVHVSIDLDRHRWDLVRVGGGT